VSKTDNTVLDVEGAVAFDSASAQNIAVDGSTISNTTDYSVSLAGSAEENASALNLVNAAGGMVANAINVSRTTNMNSAPTISQVNNISQTH
jgi:hypothetical protein